jgi:hypothetical protein
MKNQNIQRDQIKERSDLKNQVANRGNTQGSPAKLPGRNEQVLAEARKLESRFKGKGYCFKFGATEQCSGPGYSNVEEAWGNPKGKRLTGQPEDLVFATSGGNFTLMERDGNGTTHCSASTISVMSKLAAQNGLTASWSRTKLLSFFQDWMGDLKEKGITHARRRAINALVSHGIGVEIKNLDEVQPGDFVEINRSTSATSVNGHSVIFVRWITDASGKKVGFRYWSSQPSTKGMGESGECFSDQRHAECVGGTAVVQSLTYFGRLTK